MTRAYTVRIEVMQQTGLELEFDEVCATDSPENALAMVEHYRTTHPAPVTFAARVLRDDPYEPGREYPRKNWCRRVQLPIPLHGHQICLEEAERERKATAPTAVWITPLMPAPEPCPVCSPRCPHCGRVLGPTQGAPSGWTPVVHPDTTMPPNWLPNWPPPSNWPLVPWTLLGLADVAIERSVAP